MNRLINRLNLIEPNQNINLIGLFKKNYIKISFYFLKKNIRYRRMTEINNNDQTPRNNNLQEN